MFPQLLAFLADQPTFKVMISSPGGPEVEGGGREGVGVSGGGVGGSADFPSDKFTDKKRRPNGGARVGAGAGFCSCRCL